MKYSKPRIKTIYPVYRLDSETFRIGSQKNITTEFEDPTGEMWDLINFMDGRTIEDLLRAMQNKYPDITLDEVEYKEDKSDRYTGNRNYFKRYATLSMNEEDVHDKLNQSTILLLGLGGGGSLVANLLCGLGVRKLIIVDYDVIELSNLGRQFLYVENDVGKKKVTVAKERLQQINSQIEIEAIGHL
ncbi:ThiF family adenylyltransferase [Streptococcus danieliae]|uniref:ThiF family adenylyltransferase n=1 Tax=Streptococcus danieliae TaxID=747656 RepID=A0A7Z0LE38_9STRE|nr:ThiF family adenylyltransferase [Streptococcus danieliae]MBF0717884.1 ThiF family adenylyltransferase [Streptococcus danieliae]NYS49814.1 ThiF family adenylyltransferase [Streptococcus danieliae]